MKQQSPIRVIASLIIAQTSTTAHSGAPKVSGTYQIIFTTTDYVAFIHKPTLIKFLGYQNMFLLCFVLSTLQNH